MKDTLVFLKRDRRVSDTFIKKLETAGFEICYGKYDYWDSQPYLEIGQSKVWLVASYTCPNGSYALGDRYQNDVIEDIIETLRAEKSLAEREDENVNDFFSRLGLLEDSLWKD